MSCLKVVLIVLLLVGCGKFDWTSMLSVSQSVMKFFSIQNTVCDASIDNDNYKIVPKSILKVSTIMRNSAFSSMESTLIPHSPDDSVIGRFHEIHNNRSPSQATPLSPSFAASSSKSSDSKPLRQVVRFSQSFSSGRSPSRRASGPILVQLQIYDEENPTAHIAHHNCVSKRQVSTGFFTIWSRNLQRRFEKHRRLKFGRKTNYQEQMQPNQFSHKMYFWGLKNENTIRI